MPQHSVIFRSETRPPQSLEMNVIAPAGLIPTNTLNVLLMPLLALVLACHTVVDVIEDKLLYLYHASTASALLLVPNSYKVP